MQVVDNGVCSCEKLLFYLEELFRLNEDGKSLNDEIVYIENHEGYWTIGFKSVPERGLLLALFSLFETRMAFDGIGKIIFYYGHSRAVKIEDIAGCYWEGHEAMCKALEIQSLLYSVRRSEEAEQIA